jgi:hypothetical protein
MSYGDSLYTYLQIYFHMLITIIEKVYLFEAASGYYTQNGFING